MKPIKNKKHRSVYYKMYPRRVQVRIEVDTEDGFITSFNRTIDIRGTNMSNITNATKGIEIALGDISISWKSIKKARVKKY